MGIAYFFGPPIIPLAKRPLVRCPARLRCVCDTAKIAERVGRGAGLVVDGVAPNAVEGVRYPDFRNWRCLETQVVEPASGHGKGRDYTGLCAGPILGGG